MSFRKNTNLQRILEAHLSQDGGNNVVSTDDTENCHRSNHKPSSPRYPGVSSANATKPEHRSANKQRDNTRRDRAVASAGRNAGARAAACWRPPPRTTDPTLEIGRTLRMLLCSVPRSAWTRRRHGSGGSGRPRRRLRRRLWRRRRRRRGERRRGSPRRSSSSP